jgi:hypothetical protein
MAHNHFANPDESDILDYKDILMKRKSTFVDRMANLSPATKSVTRVNQNGQPK